MNWRTTNAAGWMLGLLLLGPASALHGQSILYVDGSAPTGGDGLSWETAFDDLQDALAVTPTEPVEVRLAQGAYTPGATSGASYVLVNNITIKGGFAGLKGRDPDERDINEYESILNGDINGDDASGFVNYDDNVNKILVATDLVNAGLDGITVAHGGGNALHCHSSALNIVACTFRDNLGSVGASIYLRGPASPVISGCVFQNNQATGTSGAIFVHAIAPVAQFEMSNSIFTGNMGESVGAVSIVVSGPAVISHCRFIQNMGGTTAGALALSGPPTPPVSVIACEFIENFSNFVTGGIVSQCNTSITNCMFSGNVGTLSGAYAASASATSVISDCSFSNNGPKAMLNEGSPMTIRNSIIWGSPIAISIPYEDNTAIYYSNIQGGWIGTGGNNINADPLFLQPGCHNLRLGIGSPCMNAGDNSLIPSGITTDLDGNPRILEGIVDLGAYEGEHDPLPPASCNSDFDGGELALLIPEGGAFDPLLSPAAQILNLSGGDNNFVTATQFDSLLHAGAGGYNEVGSKMAIETSIADGQFFMRVHLPFDEELLNGFPFDAVNLTYFDSATGSYELAALGNMQNSPGHNSPLGDRSVIVDTDWTTQLSTELGDYGVFWDTALGKGFVWANVDHATDFAFGVLLPACLGDTSWPSDNSVDATDLTIVLDNWGAAPSGPANFADINQDGSIDVDDLIAVINRWGECK